jgi:hypothetical protein
LLADQRGKLLTIDDRDTRTSHPAVGRFARLSPTLFNPTRPRRTHIEGLCDPLRFHPPVVRPEHPISKIL